MKYVLTTGFLAFSIAVVSCSSDSEPDGNNGTSGTGGKASAGAGGKASGSGGTNPGSGGSGGTGTAGSGGTANGSGGSGGGAGTSSAGAAGAGGSAGSSLGPVTCGSGKAKVPMGDGDSAEGVVIAPDGTIYHSQSFSGTFIGRIRPGMDPEKNWVSVGEQVLGVTYDPKRKALYAGSRSRKKILKIVVDQDTPEATEFANAEGGVNGLTLGEDDAVYYNDQTGGNVYRVAPDGKKTTVTTSAIPNGPNGLAFGPDGWLYINQWEGASVYRLKLDGTGKEIDRNVFIPKVGKAPGSADAGIKNGDGIAFDELGRIYITASGQLHQHDKDGKWVKSVASNGANIDFGVGALSCSDAYVGGNNKGLKIHTLDAKGMNVPWHRAP